MQKQRNGTIELLRFVFIVLVVLHHSVIFCKPDIIAGFIGVEFFFMVSGYLMAKSVNDGKVISIPKFIFHKIKAFYVEFLVAGCTGYFLVMIFCHYGIKQAIKTIYPLVSDFLLLQIWGIGTFSGTGVGWYLSAMIGALFFLLPLVIYREKLFRECVAPLLVLIIYGACYFKFGSVGLVLEPAFDGFLHMGLLRAIAGMSFGYLIFYGCRELKTMEFSDATSKVLSVLWGGSIVLCIAAALVGKKSTHWDFFMIMMIAIAVMISFSEKMCWHEKFQSKVCMQLGRVSKNLFLNHFYISTILAYRLEHHPETSMWELWGMYAAGIIVCTAFNYVVAGWLRRKLDARLSG